MKINKVANQKKNRRNKILLIVALFIVASVIIAGTIIFISSNNQGSESKIRPVNDVDYTGPSKEDVKSSQDAKLRGDTVDTGGVAGEKNNVAVGVAFANKEGSNLEIRAYTTGVIEGNGTCTATLTSAHDQVKESVSAFIDASSSQCKPILIPLDRLASSPEWTLIVNYNSPTSEGTTESEVIEL